jgi:hypothetical protein
MNLHALGSQSRSNVPTIRSERSTPRDGCRDETIGGGIPSVIDGRRLADGRRVLSAAIAVAQFASLTCSRVTGRLSRDGLLRPLPARNHRV